METNCGTCKWFEHEEDNEDRGDCDWHFHHKLPVAILYNQSHMYRWEGITCPCWELRQ